MKAPSKQNGNSRGSSRMPYLHGNQCWGECARAEKNPLVETRQRSENRNIMSIITHEHQKFVAVKGNPTEVLELCSQQMKDGKAVPLTESDRLAIAIENDRMAGKALRLLGVAYLYQRAALNSENRLGWV